MICMRNMSLRECTCICDMLRVLCKPKVLTKHCVRVCVCFLQARSCWRVDRLRSWHHLLVTWCKMWMSRRAIKMRNQVFALLSLSIIIMLVCASYGGGLGSSVVLMEQVVIKVLPGPKAVWVIVPDAVQRHAALYQMPPRSKGPGTSTVPCQSAKLRGMRDPRILHPRGILPAAVMSKTCMVLLFSSFSTTRMVCITIMTCTKMMMMLPQ